MASRTGTNVPPVTYIIKWAQTSPVFGKAFAKGCGGRVSDDPNLLFDGDIAMFGDPKLMKLLKEAQNQGRNWFYGDKAYFGRGTYYRITKNAYMHDCSGEALPHRWNSLGIRLQPWQNGSNILLCPQSDAFFRLHGTTQDEWVKSVKKKLSFYTDRKIKIHYKNPSQTEKMFKHNLRDIWAVVVHSSMAGAQAVINGIPCFATDPKSVSAKFGTTDLSLIETPVKPSNRDHLAWILADNQWTLSEIQSGMAWERVK